MIKISTVISVTVLLVIVNTSYADDLLINQEVTFDDAELVQEDGSNNTQAMNLVETEGTSAGIRQDVEGDELLLKQKDGSNNMQAVNLIEVGEDATVGVTWQDTEVDDVTLDQEDGTGNTQAINAVVIK